MPEVSSGSGSLFIRTATTLVSHHPPVAQMHCSYLIIAHAGRAVG
jgi:hypothetical protein